jgi:hypothetical protein
MKYRLVVAAASALALAACSPSHVDNPTINTPPSVAVTGTAGVSTPSTASLVDPCSLLTAAQVQAAFGGTSSAGIMPPTATRQECDWTVTGSKLGTNGTLAFYYPATQTSAAFEAAKAGVPGATKVPELGDDAFYTAPTAALTVLVGEHQFVVQGDFGRSADAGDLQADLIAVAQDAETHL